MIYVVYQDMRCYYNHIQLFTGLRSPFSIRKWSYISLFFDACAQSLWQRSARHFWWWVRCVVIVKFLGWSVISFGGGLRGRNCNISTNLLIFLNNLILSFWHHHLMTRRKPKGAELSPRVPCNDYHLFIAFLTDLFDLSLHVKEIRQFYSGLIPDFLHFFIIHTFWCKRQRMRQFGRETQIVPIK